MGGLTVVGLGPAGSDLVTPLVKRVLDAADRVYLRTHRHPAAAAWPDAESFDEVYDRGEDFAAVYEEIVERLVAVADDGVVYAVPGSPLVLERTVELLRDAERAGIVELDVLPAMSFLDTAWAALGIDPVEEGVRLIDGHRFAVQAAGQTGPLLVAHCHANHVLSDIKLAVDDPPEKAVILQRLGLDDAAVMEVDWAELDRTVTADHLTTLYIPELAEPVAAEFARFDELVRTLRDQCPWDREQTHASLRRHLLEEAHETIEALDARAELDDAQLDPDLDEHLAEELGDLLYQIFFHARLGAERGAFAVSDVARGVHDKLVVRHPHVFGGVAVDGTEDVVRNWEQIKAEEKGRTSAVDGIPPSLPALMRALKVQKRAAGAGFDWDGGVEAAFADVDDELAEVRADPSEAEVGDLLFAAVQVARRLDVDPEGALRGAVHRYEARFRLVEEQAGSAEALAGADERQLTEWWALAKAGVEQA